MSWVATRTSALPPDLRLCPEYRGSGSGELTDAQFGDSAVVADELHHRPDAQSPAERRDPHVTLRKQQRAIREPVGDGKRHRVTLAWLHGQFLAQQSPYGP